MKTALSQSVQRRRGEPGVVQPVHVECRADQLEVSSAFLERTGRGGLYATKLVSRMYAKTNATPITVSSSEAWERRLVHSVPCPIECPTGQGDFPSGAQEVSALLQRSGSAVPHGWYRFHKDGGVPHAMVSPAQSTAPCKTQKVHDIIFDFVDQGRTVHRK